MMPKRDQDKIVTARLLQLLAPSSGLKTPYSAEDLASNIKFSLRVVESELQRLSGARILRTRDYSTVVLYELQHDAFIKVLRQWRNDVLEHVRLRKRMWRLLGAAAFACVVLVAGLAFYGQHERLQREQERRQQALQFQRAQQELKDLEAKQELSRVEAERESKEVELQTSKNYQEGGLLKEIEDYDPKKRDALAPSRFDLLTAYFLWDDPSDPEKLSLSKLRTALQLYEPLIPDGYALRLPKNENDAEHSPLTVEYSKARKWNSDQFMTLWHDFATEIARTFGYPVPLQIAFKEVPPDKLRADELVLVSMHRDRFTVKAPMYGNRLLVRFKPSEISDNRIRDFLEKYVDSRTFEPDPRWILVPRWSLPVWKVAKETEMKKPITYPEVATDPSGIAAYHVLVEMLGLGDAKGNARKTFLTETAVETLLRNASRLYPTTVKEARAERESCLVRDLGDEVQRDPYALLALPLLLDRLANERCESQAEGGATTPRGGANASQVRTTTPQNSGVELLPPREGTQGAEVREDLQAGAFAGLEKNLPSSDTRFWVYGANGPQGNLENIRDDLYRKYGVLAPVPRFSKSSADDPAAASVVRVEIKDGINPMDAIRSKAEENRGLWITPETTKALLDRLPPNTQHWIEKQYSLTSIKLLERMVIGSNEAGGNIRYPTWLLSSLCFWAIAEPGDFRNGAKLAALLRRTERARTVSSAAEISPVVRQLVAEGVDRLVADDRVSAMEKFKYAVEQNRAQAEQAFLAAWPQRVPEFWLGEFRSRFENLRYPYLTPGELIDLDDLQPTGQFDNRLSREISVDRLAANVVEPGKRTQMLGNLLIHTEAPDDWTPEQARFVAVEFLKQYDPFDPKTGDVREFNGARTLIESAVKRMDQQSAWDAFREVVVLSGTNPHDPSKGRDIPNWSWPLLNEIAELRPDGATSNLQFELAWQLAGEERVERLNRSLALVNNYEKILAGSEMDESKRSNSNDLINYARARALYNRGMQGDQAAYDEAEKLFRKTRSSGWVLSERPDIAQAAYARLVGILSNSGRAEEARTLWQEAASKWRGDDSSQVAAIYGAEMFGLLGEGNAVAASRIALEEADRASELNNLGDNANQWLFEASVGSIVTQTNDWRGLAKRFLDRDRQDARKDYILLIFFGFDGGTKSAQASELLNRRWNEIVRQKSNWKARLRSGDASAWREMLVGRFVGTPESESLLDEVNDEERWKESDLAYLPISQRGLQCEFWFYEAMRAKATGQRDRMRECLRRCVAVGFRAYIEDSIARFLLSTPGA